MSRVNLDTKAFSDFRFRVMGDRIGIHRDHAMGLMARVWSYCQDNETYFIQGDLFDLIVEQPGAFEAAQRAGLVREEERQCWYVCGTRGRIEWVEKLRKAAKKGGAATKKRWRAPTEAEDQGEPQGRPDGRPQGGPYAHAETRPMAGPLTPSSCSLLPSPAQKTNTAAQVSEALSQAKATWAETLKFFGHNRNCTSREERLIYEALRSDSPLLVHDALRGARFEPIVKDFNPAKAPDLSRILGDLDRPRNGKPSQIAKFAGYSNAAPALDADISDLDAIDAAFNGGADRG